MSQTTIIVFHVNLVLTCPGHGLAHENGWSYQFDDNWMAHYVRHFERHMKRTHT